MWIGGVAIVASAADVTPAAAPAVPASAAPAPVARPAVPASTAPVPAAAQGEPDLVPPDGFHAGWTRSEPARVFKGAELFGHIDGGAEIFLELGFDALTLQRYRRVEEEVVLEIYRMTDPEAAWGIYLAKCGKETPDPRFAERHTTGRYQLAFVRGRYYVLVTNDGGTPELAALLLDAARFVAERLPAAEPPSRLSILPKEGLIPSSVRMVRGRFGLQAVAGSLGDGDLLLLGGKVTAVAGDYRQAGSGARTMLLTDYPSSEAAAAAFEHLRAGLDPLLTVLSSTGNRVVFQDPRGTFGLVARNGARLTVELDLATRPAEQ